MSQQVLDWLIVISCKVAQYVSKLKNVIFRTFLPNHKKVIKKATIEMCKIIYYCISLTHYYGYEITIVKYAMLIHLCVSLMLIIILVSYVFTYYNFP